MSHEIFHRARTARKALPDALKSATVASSSDVGTPQPKTVQGVCKTRGIQKDSTSPCMPDELKALTRTDLIALLQRQARMFDDADLAILYRETLRELERLDQLARERRSVEEACNFARFALYGGLLTLFRLFPQPPPLEVSAVKLEAVAKETLFHCEEAWKGKPDDIRVTQSELQTISAKLDRVLGAVPQAAGPALRIVER